MVGGIATVAGGIGGDVRARLPGQHERRREGSALLAATVPDVRGADLTDLAASPPRAAGRPDMRHRWIGRLPGDERIAVGAAVAPHGREILAHPAANGRTVVLVVDQARATGRHRVVTVAARAGGRASPSARRVEATGGAIGFPERREAPEAAARLLPEGARPVLVGDRFHGSPELIARCRARGRDWRPRLERGLLVFEDGGETTLAACLARGEHPLSGVEPTGKRVATNVAVVHEPGHPEPWIIALSEPPTAHRAFDHGLRWGVEATFPGFETRGFGLEDSHIQRPERLLLVVALALLRAVSTGMRDAVHRATPDEEKSRRASPATSAAA